MIEIINILRSNEFYGCSDNIEIAKGKNEMVTSWKGFKRKIIRQWQLKRKL
jgi:hypothetical protein